MFNENISNKYIVKMEGTSEGSQVKYRKGIWWYKKDHQGREGYTEYLVSKMLTYSNLKPSEYIQYEYGMINGFPGCRSKNFLKNGQELITFYRLYYSEFGKDLSKVIAEMETMEERISYVTRFIRQSCRLDITDYLKKIFTLDTIILNEDRHFNNLAVVFDDDGFHPAPIFDNGVSLLTANKSIRQNLPLSENVKRVIARPFSGSHELLMNHFGKGFSLDYNAVLDWLLTEEESLERDVLLYQISKFQNLN